MARENRLLILAREEDSHRLYSLSVQTATESLRMAESLDLSEGDSLEELKNKVSKLESMVGNMRTVLSLWKEESKWEEGKQESTKSKNRR